MKAAPARRLVHPGQVRAERVTTALAARQRRALVWLPEGETLHDALVQAFTSLGARTGAFYLLGGTLAVAAYHVALPQAESSRAVEYGQAILIEGGAGVVRATGSFGQRLEGGPLLHIHGSLADAAGHGHGGHINPELCVAGPGGIRAILMLAVGFNQGIDEETGFSLFFPVAGAI
jgi:predicted DNA-binding protein with PD1-like motif